MSRSWFVSTPPRSLPTMPRGMPISLSTDTRTVLVLGHVDADHLLLVAEQELGHRLGQLGLADAGRAQEQQHAVGPVEPALERSLVEHQAVRQRAHRLTLPHDAAGRDGFEVLEPLVRRRGTPCRAGSAPTPTPRGRRRWRSRPSAGPFPRARPPCPASRSPCRAGADAARSAAPARAPSRPPRRAAAPNTSRSSRGLRPFRIRRVSSMVGSGTTTVRKRRASASSSWMYDLYSLIVVAPIIRTSPRASTDLKMLAASAGAPIAEPAPTSVWASSTNRIRFGCSLISLITAWTRSSNIPRSIVPATTAFICRLTMWQSRSRPGTVSGSSSMRRASPSTMAVLPTPGSPISITEFERSRWHRISSTCWISSSRPITGGELVLPRQQVQVHGEVLERRPAARTACAAAPREARCRGNAWPHAPPARPARRRAGGRS